MGYGLQKGSPVQLTLGKDNYEALIERHGQWIRWRQGTKCPCTQRDTMQPDPQCPRCGGTGVFFTCQKEIAVTQAIGINDDSGIIEVPAEYEAAALDVVYDYNGRKYPAEKDGVFISLDDPPQKGTYLYVVMVMETTRRLSEAGCENAGGGYYRISGLRSRRAGIDGLYQTAPADILKIGKIADAGGREFEAGELRADMFTVKIPPAPEGEEPVEIAEPLSVRDVEYVPPFVFALQSQNLSNADAKELEGGPDGIKGDAICTFPYNCDVGDGDVLTVLAGTYTQKEVVNRVDGEYDVIGAYFVMDVSSCTGVNREYRKGADFILAGTNRIKWLCADAPEHGEAYSITYQICPTYKVIRAVPQLRTSENQRLPKKAVVQLYSAYGEKRGVNRQ